MQFRDSCSSYLDFSQSWGPGFPKAFTTSWWLYIYITQNDFEMQFITKESIQEWPTHKHREGKNSH